MFVEIVTFLLKMFASYFCVDIASNFAMIIESYITACFCFSIKCRNFYIKFYIKCIPSNILNLLHSWRCGIFYIFFGLLTLKSNCFSYLLVTKWPQICQAWRAFVWFLVLFFTMFFSICYFLLTPWHVYFVEMMLLAGN